MKRENFRAGVGETEFKQGLHASAPTDCSLASLQGSSGAGMDACTLHAEGDINIIDPRGLFHIITHSGVRP